MSQKNLYKVFEDVVVRTPLLPTNSTFDRIFDQPLAKNALAIGSPSLYDQYKRGNKSSKTQIALLKYKKRMSYRPTPYGMFAGISLASFDKHTNLERKPNGIKTFTRPDMSWFMPLVDKVESNKGERSNLKFIANPDVLLRGGRVWLERPDPVEPNNHNTVNIKATEPVLEALAICRTGTLFESLCTQLMQKFQVQRTIVEDLCHQLCDLKILISSLRFALPDWSSLHSSLDHSKQTQFGKDLYSDLRNIRIAAESWDQSKDKTGESYVDLLEDVRSVVPDDTMNILQTDASFELTNNSISEKVGFEMARASELLLRLSTREIFDSRINWFLNQFREQYQEDREVPLLELLSPSFGLGSPYHQQYNSSFYGTGRSQLRRRNTLLLEMATNAIRDGQLNIELSDDQVSALEMWSPSLETAPLSLEMFASISAESREDIDNGDFKVVVSPRTGENGAGRSLGRFAHIIESQSTIILKSICSEEQRISKDLLVDINYWPAYPRYANVSIAPMVRSHSVTANTSPPRGSTDIPLAELNIGIENNRFYARWIRTGQKISARSNNLLNPSVIPDTVRFLLDIANSGTPKISQFDWGTATSLVFLPRVSYGKSILSLARWNLKQFVAEISTKKNTISFQDKLNTFRGHWNVPKCVVLTTHASDDNNLFLDLDDANDLELLESLLLKSAYKNAVFMEYIPIDKWNCGKEGSYATELVASFLRADVNKESNSNSTILGEERQLVSQSDYLRVPGSDWVYLQLNSNKELHEEIIMRASLLARKLKDNGSVIRWYYVRYAEHYQDKLRFRFKVNQQALFSLVLPELMSWATNLVQTNYCKSFSFDSYNREVERYGGSVAIDLVEEFFHVDSTLVSSLYPLAGYGNKNSDLSKPDRGLIALVTIDSMLDAFAMSDQAKEKLLNPASRYIDRKLLSTQYRQLKDTIYKLLTKQFPESEFDEISHIIEHIESTKIDLIPIAKRLLNYEKRGKLTKPINTICQSLIHLHCIRLFGVDRQAENLVRALLAKGLESKIMRAK